MSHDFPKVFDRMIDVNGKVKYLIMKWIDETKLNSKEYKAVKRYCKIEKFSKSNGSYKKLKVSSDRNISPSQNLQNKSIEYSCCSQSKQIGLEIKQYQSTVNNKGLIHIKSESKRSRSQENKQDEQSVDSFELRLIDNIQSNSPIQRTDPEDIEDLNLQPAQQLTLNDIIINNIIRCNYFKDLKQWKVLVSYVLNDYSKPDTIWISAESVYLKEKVMLFQFLKKTNQLQIVEDIQAKLEDKQSFLTSQLNQEII